MSVTADVMDANAKGAGPVMIRDYGDHALLLEFDNTDEVLAWSAAIRDAELLGVLDIVPASRTVLIKLAGARYQAPTRQRLGKLHVRRGGRMTSDDGGRRHPDRGGLRRSRSR